MQRKTKMFFKSQIYSTIICVRTYESSNILGYEALNEPAMSIDWASKEDKKKVNDYYNNVLGMVRGNSDRLVMFNDFHGIPQEFKDSLGDKERNVVIDIHAYDNQL